MEHDITCCPDCRACRSNRVSLFRAWNEVVSKLVEYEYESGKPEIDWYIDRMKQAFSTLSATHEFDADFERTRQQLKRVYREEANG